MPSWTELKSRLQRLFSRRPRDPQSAAARPWPRHWRILKWSGIGFAGAVALCVLVLAFMDWNAMRGPVARYLSARMGREVRIDGDLAVHLFSWTPRATVNAMTVSEPDWVGGTGHFADVGRLTVALDLWRLLGWRLILTDLEVEHSTFNLMRDAAGRENWQVGADENAPFHLPPIQHFVISDGMLNFVDERRKLVFAGMVASREDSDAAGARTFQLTGKGELNRQPFALEASGDPLLNIAPDKPYGFKLDVRSGATHIEGQGRLAKPFNLGSFDMVSTFTGSDLADLYYLTGLALPNTRSYKLSGDLKREGEFWRLDGLTGKVGETDLKGNLSVDGSGERSLLKADLASQKLDFDDLGPLIGAPSHAVKGVPVPEAQKEIADKKATAVAAHVLPDTPLRVERLRQMDADVHYRAQTVVSEDFPLRSAELTLSLKDGVLRLDPVSMGFAHGTMAGSIQIDARKDLPASDIDLRLTGLQLSQFLAKGDGPPEVEGEAVARAKLHGTGDTVHKAASTAEGTVTFVVPKGLMRQSSAELLGINISSALGLLLTNDKSQIEIRCAVAHFTTAKGTMSLQQFVFDTGVVRVSGEGTVDLGRERLDLAVTGHPKEPRLIRVHAPITVTGPLDHPQIGVKAGTAVLQGGLAVGLATVLSPLAAILPFVDPGLAKDADCAGLTREAQAQGAPKTPAKTR